MVNRKTLVALVGPTASGKTALSIKLAKELSCEIISADSRQFYREMNIGTAKIADCDMQEIPHHFIDFISIHENYNSGKFESEVLEFLKKHFLQNHLALMVGGSGLYVQAVCEGMDKIPPSDNSVREKLKEELQEHGLSFLLEKLKFLDEKYFGVVDKKNPHRVIRALEVCMISGFPYSSFRFREGKSFPYKEEVPGQAEAGKRPFPGRAPDRPEEWGGAKKNSRGFNIIKIGIELSRKELNDKINDRVDEMIQKGLINEAEKLLPYRNLNALRTLGYEELFDYFEKKKLPDGNPVSLEKTIELIKRNTRRFAKRQMTWFRKDKEINWFPPGDYEKILSLIYSKI